MRVRLTAMLVLGAWAASPASAGLLGMADRHYYGPLKGFEGVGYTDRLEQDGSSRIRARSRLFDGRGFSLTMALYRAAEIARAANQPYVQILGGHARKATALSGEETDLYVRAADGAAPPASCRPVKASVLDRERIQSPCFTASVAHLLTEFGGTGGTQPGVPLRPFQDGPLAVFGFGAEQNLAARFDRATAAEPSPQSALPVPVVPTEVGGRALSPYEQGLLAGRAARAQAGRSD